MAVTPVSYTHLDVYKRQEMTRRHNDSNMLAMGAGIIGNNLAERIVDTFLNTQFEGGRHQRRIDKMMAIEQ